MEAAFWISFLWIAYSYVGYLSLLTLFALFRKRSIRKSEIYPRVSLIIAAHDEEKAITNKIKNALALDYPKDKLEIMVASDCSTDRTDEIVSAFQQQGVRLVRQQERRGKTAAQNLAAKYATGKILAFSDATTIYDSDALRKLVRNFNDPKVGCVGGEERFIKPGGTLVGEEVGLFWKYEQLLRQRECEFNTLIGVSGCIFAIRKEFYESLPESLIEDFALPLKVASKGYRVVYEKEAVGYEETVFTGSGEFARKVRIVVGGINGLVHMPHLLNPFRYPLLAFQLISHKIFRWLTPFFLLMLFWSNISLLYQSPIYYAFGVLQSLCYGLAFLGFLFQEVREKPRLFRIPYYFCLVNLAALVGILRFLCGERKVAWSPVR